MKSAGLNDVIIVEDYSEEDPEPVAKRRRLDESSKDTNRRVEKEVNVETENSAVSCSQKASVTFIEDDEYDLTDPLLNGGQDMSVFSSIKDAWRNCLTNNNTALLYEITKLSSTDMHNFCKFIDFESMGEESLEVSCKSICTLSESLSFSNVTVFLKYCLCSRVQHLSQNASRRLAGAITHAAQVYPKPFIDAVIVPCLELSEVTLGQSEVICRVVKEELVLSTRGYLMHMILHNGVLIKGSKLQVLHTLLESSCEMSEQDMFRLVSALIAVSREMAKNLMFSKLLLVVVKEYPDLVKKNFSGFQIILDNHESFMKKKISTLVTKLKRYI